MHIWQSSKHILECLFKFMIFDHFSLNNNRVSFKKSCYILLLLIRKELAMLDIRLDLGSFGPLSKQASFQFFV